VEPGLPDYICYSDVVLVAGEDALFEFGLRIDEVIANAKGYVAVNEPCECEGFQDDLDMSNNRRPSSSTPSRAPVARAAAKACRSPVRSPPRPPVSAWYCWSPVPPASRSPGGDGPASSPDPHLIHERSGHGGHRRARTFRHR
jgi:hypothetical protein